ncbi:MAG: 5-formyltetrahydrofolate cyclo-ligase [Nitrospinae bacterium]|nr:5-formyltetrahydrofolate cyclo-ligase [Nitrospinota bacterium]
MNKASVRQQLLNVRNSLPKKKVADLSSEISSIFLQQVFFKRSNCLLLYLNVGNEVNTTDVINCAMNEKKALFLPFTEIVDEKIEVRTFNGWNSLIKGKFGILYPSEKGVDIKESGIDLVVIPGVAFDEKGNRIGFGKGFYDQLLHRKNDVIKVALAYELQVMKESLPKEKHDVHVDYIVTEKRVINCNENRGEI